MQTNLTDRQIGQIARRVVETLRVQARWVPLGVSNRHLHLSRADMDALFGPGSELTFRSELGQPGQYAAEEVVTLKGPKGELARVRVLGPLRGETQVEISVSDSFKLGVRPPVRDSGRLEDSPGIELVGPKGAIQRPRGVIAAWRHIHLDPLTARLAGLEDKQRVRVRLGEERAAVLHNVLVRVSPQYEPEMHLDMDEANAVGIKNGDLAEILLD